VDGRFPADLLVTGDPGLLRILLENLLGNAWKFTGKRPRATIELGVVAGQQPPVYFVRDDGAGFDMRHAQHLFQPFKRMHSEGEFACTGIGLATVYRIVERHGGRIWAEAAPDKGATFSFTLPGARKL
jgi:signal transduction histidine kinase